MTTIETILAVIILGLPLLLMRYFKETSYLYGYGFGLLVAVCLIDLFGV